MTRQNCAFTKICLALWGGFWYSNRVLRIGRLIQGTYRLPAWRSASNRSYHRVWVASDESVRARILETYQKGTAFVQFRLLCCISKGILTHLIRCIGGGAMFPCAKSEINQQRERQRKKDDEQINEVYSLAGCPAGRCGDGRAPWRRSWNLYGFQWRYVDIKWCHDNRRVNEERHADHPRRNRGNGHNGVRYGLQGGR